jgi:hypothetical protein
MGAGVENVGGDMFVSVPQADAVFMKVSFFIYLFIETTMKSPSSFHSMPWRFSWI